MHERRRSVLYKRTTRYFRVLIESEGGSVSSTLSEGSVRIWAGYTETMRVIYYHEDGTEEILDLEKIKKLAPPLPELPSLPSPGPLPHVPNYQQERLEAGTDV